MSRFETLSKFLVLMLIFVSCKSVQSTNSNGKDINGEGGVFCPLLACAAPPENCHYEGTTYQEGCVVSCGTLVCDTCPIPECAAPPEGCTYGTPEVVEGCPVGCGPLVCPIGVCPLYMCAAPPIGCHYTPGAVDENGCAIGCGDLTCGGQ